MRVSSYLVLAVLVTALGGMTLGALIFERQQQFDENYIEATKRMQQLHDAQRLIDQVKQLMISVDLLFGAQETYMLAPSARQAELAMNFSVSVYDGLRDIDHLGKALLQEIQKHLNTLILETTKVQIQASGATLIISNQQLDRVDVAAEGLVDTVSALQTLFKDNLQRHQEQSRNSRSHSNSITYIGVAVYLMSIVMVLWWASRAVSKPLRMLAHSARTALKDKSSFKPLVHGPAEVRALTNHIGQFVESLQETIAQNRALINAIPDSLFVVNRALDIKLSKLDPTTQATLNQSELSPKFFQDTLGFAQTETAAEKITTCLTQQTQQQFSLEIHTPDSVRHFEARVTPATSEDAVLIIRDLTDKHQAESRIRHMAYHDGLTGLLNRRAFKECLEQHFESDGENHCALFYLDVDRFKTINDTHGHDIGDTTLLHVSKSLANCLRSADSLASVNDAYDDVAARLGGDEFVALLPGVTDPEVAESIAKRLQRVLDRPFFYKDQQIEVTVSIGVALYPQHGHDSETLMKSADLAMFKAKRMGGNDVFVYESEMGEQIRKKTTLESKLRLALNNDDLFLLYQPKIDLSSGLIVGVEALVRWQDGDSVIPPNDFIPLAEETGLILPLGEFVIKSALQQIAQWRDGGMTLDHVAINVSAAQLQQPGFCSSILAAVDRAKVDPSMLNIEITESLLIGQYSSSLAVLNELRGAGFTIAMDDFGTGYSSLSYIKNLPLDILKIDRSFVMGISESKTERAIIKSIIEMGQTLGLRLVAEGVETTEQAEFLQYCSCNEAQGYLYSPPVSPEEIHRLFNEQPTQRLRVIQ